MTKKQLRKGVLWDQVWQRLGALAAVRTLPDGSDLWRADQEKSLRWIARQLSQQPGVLVADEVGLGKTRLAVALAICVAASGGRVAVLIPPGLTYQWRDEELRGLTAQLQTLGLPWLPKRLTTKVLRTYPDLFPDSAEPQAYPIAEHADIVFLSHRFGLPSQLTNVKRHDLWALPFMLKKLVVGDGRKVRGAGVLAVNKGQERALDWLAGRLPARLKKRMTEATFGKVSAAAFKDECNRTLFENLIGELVGDFDLIIIDEAHKSRAGADKAVETMLQTRLTRCVEHILLRPGGKSAMAKRLALTATPMEMSADQWTAILCRLGLPEERVKALKSIVIEFEKAVQEVRVGTLAELRRLSSAAAAFQQEMKELMTRRLWRDHPCVQRFARTRPNVNVAHPHRRMIPCLTRLSELSPRETLQLAVAESIAITSKSMSSGHALKTAGARFSQGLPLMMEAGAGKTTAERKDRPKESKASAEPVADADPAKLKRQEYWIKCLESLSEDMGDVSKEARWSLQWHPRVLSALRLIESLTDRGEKVLVFGEFVDSLRALERALNIRHYLQHVRDGRPLPLPTGVKSGDPDVLRWLESDDLAFPEQKIRSFHKDAESLSGRYIADRAGLREVCQRTVDQFFKDQKSAGGQLDNGSRHALVTWLVQQLCASDQVPIYSESRDHGEIKTAVESMLRDLRDADPAARQQADDDEASQAFDWARVIKDQENDLEKNETGQPVFRMSPFAQMLYGDTKPSTRRVRQSAFNNRQLNPQVLIGQSVVASEGLNLHRACRSIVLFHLDWNPGRIEQQIGRVDRQDSAWMAAFTQWDGKAEAPPYIDIYTVAIEGTYDAFRTEVVRDRARVLKSQLFGEILSSEQLATLDEEARQEVARIQVDFRPADGPVGNDKNTRGDG